MAALMVMVGGCARFEPLSLPDQPDLASDAASLAGVSAGPERPALDIVTVGRLAAARNPDLVAARARLSEADARKYASRLFADPQLSLGLDVPTSDLPGLVNAFSIGPAYDVRSLVLRGANIDAADLARIQTALSLDWQAWQVMQKARDIYIQLAFQDARIDVLQRQANLFRADYTRQARLLDAAYTTLDALATSLIGLADADQSLRRARRERLSLHNQLAALLGLRPEATIKLTRLPELVMPDADAVATLLETVSRRRPDLLALQAGYHSQDAKLRAAVLGQFPSLSVGSTYAGDTGNVKTIGIGITLNLPVFDGNRGAIAIETATRARLNAEYQARLDAATSEALALLQEAGLLLDEVNALKPTVGELRKIADKAREAFLAGNFPALTYTTLQSSRYLQEINLLDRRQSLWQALNGLATLLGGGGANAAALGVNATALSQ